MDWTILLIALTLAFLYLLKERKSFQIKQDRSKTPTPAIGDPRINRIVTGPAISNGLLRQLDNADPYGTGRIINTAPTWESTIARAYSQLQARDQNRREKNMVAEWRRSIVGLVRLADQNLRLARQHLTMAESKVAIQNAATSVENVSRALIHSYGGKPDDDLGQEEVLELLSFRFIGEEKEEFEKSIPKIAKIDVHTRNSLNIANCDQNEAKVVINLASEITLLFKRILINHFTTEIPELGEACPKCGSLDIQTLAFNQQQTNVQCLNCQNKWTESREP